MYHLYKNDCDACGYRQGDDPISTFSKTILLNFDGNPQRKLHLKIHGMMAFDDLIIPKWEAAKIKLLLS